LERPLRDVLDGLPAVLIVGPRASGKTTTARRLATTFVRLDRDAEAQPFRDDPDSVLASLSPPVLLDEWQMVPAVLASVKRAVDDDPKPGRYILTGSVRAELLNDAWAATGRVVKLTQWGLSQRELRGTIERRSWFDGIFADEIESLKPPTNPPKLPDYVEMALRGMYPAVALQESASNRKRWLSAYLEQLLGRDAQLVNEHRDPVRLRRYLQAIATNTAGVVEHKTLYDAAGIGRMTATAYDSLLEMLFVTERVPAWHSNRLNRLTRSPKRYLTDSALMGPLLGVDSRAVLRDGDLLGRLIDTFAVSQLRPEAELAEDPITLHHLRLDTGRHEVDILAEAPDGRLIAIEIKASAAPKPSDAAHLVWLREQLGKKVHAAIVLHTGPRTYGLGNGVLAMPIATSWGG
jgi:predicted AAA+ superfamily ATPase